MLRGVADPSHKPTLGTLSVAAPAYDEAAGLSAWADGWLRALSSGASFTWFEIVVCNDGSQDETGALLDDLAARDSRIRALHHPRNRGAGCAVSTAIAATRGDWVLVVDSDGQFPPACLDAFAAARAAHPHAEAFFGARRRKEDTAFARFGARVTNASLNALHGTAYRDLSSACLLVRGPVARSLAVEARGLNYSIEIASKLLEAGLRPVEVVVPHVGRPSGRSARTVVRSTVERAAFVAWLGARCALQRAGVIAPADVPLPTGSSAEGSCASR
jgi:glycosyltransferase involved in cell wall biosynthesis